MRNGTIAKQEEILIVPSRSARACTDLGASHGLERVSLPGNRGQWRGCGRPFARLCALPRSAGHGKRGSGVIVVAIRDWRATETVAT